MGWTERGQLITPVAPENEPTTEVAYCENGVNESLYGLTTAQIVDCCTLLVEARDTPFWIEWGMALRIYEGGQGAIQIQLCEVVDGIPYIRGLSNFHFDANQAPTNDAGVAIYKRRLEGNGEDRFFYLAVRDLQEGSDLRTVVHNLPGAETWMRAVPA